MFLCHRLDEEVAVAEKEAKVSAKAAKEEKVKEAALDKVNTDVC